MQSAEWRAQNSLPWELVGLHVGFAFASDDPPVRIRDVEAESLNSKHQRNIVTPNRHMAGNVVAGNTGIRCCQLKEWYDSAGKHGIPVSDGSYHN